MSFYEITGGSSLYGGLHVQGAKNSVLPLMTATLLAPGEYVLHHCPRLSDVKNTCKILEYLGCQVKWEGDALVVNTAQLTRTQVPDQLMRKLRSSVLVLGALTARAGECELGYPGGCELGPRPIDLHLSALGQLGAELTEQQGNLTCATPRGLQGREICLSIPSVGATENVMLAACGARGITRLVGAAREPEIVELQQMLVAMGARVQGAGGSVITVEGGAPLHPVEYTVMGDRIAATTYLCGVAAAGGEVELTGVPSSTLTAVTCCLEEAGCLLHLEPERMVLQARQPLHGIRTVRTAPYPGFPTDGQALLMAALAGGRGSTMLVETMFDSRYRHVEELIRMGADIQLADRVAVVTGRALHGAAVQCTDLRGGAALVVAALAAQGRSQITEVGHIQRGYEDMVQQWSRLGAQIRQMDGEEGEG